MGCYGSVLRAAAIQMSSGSDKRANVERAEALIRAAAKQGAELVVLPEVFSWRGPRGAEAEFAEPIPGPTSERLAALHELCVQAAEIDGTARRA